MAKKSEYQANEMQLEKIQLRATMVLFGSQANCMHKPLKDYLKEEKA